MNMHSTPISTAWQPTYLDIEVRANEDDGTFETDLCCALNQCGKTVSIDSDGPKTIQNVSCTEHGFLASFPHQGALAEFVRRLANEILAKKGHTLIEAAAGFIVGDEPPRAKSIN